MAETGFSPSNANSIYDSDGAEARTKATRPTEIAHSHLRQALRPLRLTCGIYALSACQRHCSEAGLPLQRPRNVVTWFACHWKPLVIALAMIVNLIRSLGVMGDEERWVMGVVSVLWYALCLTMHVGFWYGGGVATIEQVLLGIQEDGLAFYSKADADWLAAKARKYMLIANLFAWINVSLVGYSLFGPVDVLFDQMGRVAMYPSQRQDRLSAFSIMFIIFHVFNSAAWAVHAAAVSLLSRCLTHAFRHLYDRVQAIEHWRMGAERSRFSVHEIRVMHKKLATRAAQASKAFNPLLTAIFFFDLPLIVFLLYFLAKRPIEEDLDTEDNIYVIALSLFWTLVGIFHLGFVSMCAWGVEAASDDLVVDLLEPEKTAILGVGEKQELQLFLEYLRAKPVGFSVGNLLVTKSLFGTMTSIVLTYFVALITI